MSLRILMKGRRNFNVVYQLGKWHERHRHGVCFHGRTSFILKSGNVKSADVAWVSNDRLNGLEDKDAHLLCPEFVVEQRSPADSIPESHRRMREWIESGCKLGWLIDADQEIVYIFRPERVSMHSNFNEPLSAEPVLRHFQLVLSELRQ